MKKNKYSYSILEVAAIKRVVTSFVILAATLVLSGCMEEMNLSNFNIQYPVNNATYIGTVNNLPASHGAGTFPLQDKFIITYTSPPSGKVDIVLNGHDISKYFVFGPTSTTGDIEKFKQFFRQGSNSLSVAPTSFGPLIIFNLDIQGPKIIITRGEVNGTGTAVEIEGFLRDFSLLDSQMQLNLVNINGYEGDGRLVRSLTATKQITVNADGSFCACGTSKVALGTALTGGKPLLYSFTAKDIYGFKSEIEYMADTDGITALPLPNAVRVAVGDSFIASMRPIIASAIYESLQEAPIDVRNACWDDTNVVKTVFPDDPNGSGKCPSPKDGSVFPRGLNPLNVNIGLGDMPTTVTRMFLNDDPSKTATMLLNRFVLLENNEMSLDLVITEMEVKLDIDGGWFLGHIIMQLYIERTKVDSVAVASAVNKKMHVELDPNRSNIVLEGISSSELKIWGINIGGGFISTILDALAPTIAGMLPGIINPILEENLQKMVIGGTITQPENNTSFDLLLNIAELGTDNLLGPGMPYDLKVDLESVVDIIKSDPYVDPILGPVYFDDPVDPALMYNSLGDTGTNLTVAVNSNLINQSLASLHATGVTFFTSHNGVTYYGAHPNVPAIDPTNPGSLTKAVEGDSRIRLWPNLPPVIKFSEVVGEQGQGRAAIEFESATLYLDKLKKVSGQLVWQPDLELQVNFDLAVGIKEMDGVFTMAAAGPPVFTINEMINHTPFQIPRAIIQTVLDVAMLFGGDILADQFIVLDLGTIAGDTINGTEVKYMSDKDDYKITGAGCMSFDDNGDPVSPLPAGVTNGSDGKYDLICEEINFIVTTNTAGVTGAKGSNLFFQMEARDPAIPPAPALPRLDLDDDNVIDYRDNCRVLTGDLSDAIKLAGELPGNVDLEGKPIGTFEDDIRYQVNKILAIRHGGSAAAIPSAGDQSWYNIMRAGDTPLSGGSLGSYPWIRMFYSNTSQMNIDGDRVGDLCENDDDRDGIWASYDDHPENNDNCPYIANSGQEDTLYPPGVGDACNVRTTFVLLRSLESAQGGTPQCLTRAGLTGTQWVSDTLKSMVACNPADTNQRWYMKALNPNDLNAGVEFYNNSSRNSNSDYRLTAFGEAKTWDYGNKETRVNEMRLLQTNNAGLKGQNDDSVSACAVWPCNRSQERADPVFFFRGAGASNNYVENIHPWYIDTSFGTGRNSVTYPYPFANSDWTNLGKTSCMTYSSGWGVDIDSTGDTGNKYCGVGAAWRWAIWVGATDSPWNGVW